MLDSIKALVPKIPASTAYIDTNVFKPIAPEIERLMIDCGMCRGCFWSLGDKSSDILMHIPRDAMQVAYTALDPFERGYFVSVYQAEHRAWPNRVFTFVTAHKDGESYVYESPSGPDVSLPTLIKALASQVDFWSWRSEWGRIYMGLAAIYFAVGIGVLFVDIPDTVFNPTVLKTIVSVLMCIVGPCAILWFPPRRHNAAVVELIRKAFELED